MRTPVLHSCFADQIRNFISLRQLAGTDYESQALLLEYFDRYLVEENVSTARITQQITDRYQERLSHLRPRGRYNRFSVVRQLCEYLAQKDPLSYVPEPLKVNASLREHNAYIYTKTEIKTLMAAASQLLPVGSLRPCTYRTLLGLLYVTGIRVGEAFSLNLDDFHSGQQMLYIRKAKFRKARWVPLVSSTCQALEQYLQRRMQIEPRMLDSALFLNLRSRRLHPSTVNIAFHQLLSQCGIQNSKDGGARIHDLRHTFATHRLLQWYREEQDVNARLPWLATYMGHVDISSTQIYLKATPELLQEVDTRFHTHYLRYVEPQGERS